MPGTIGGAKIVFKNQSMEKSPDSIALPLIDAMVPDSNQSHKIKSLLINFDHIDSQRNVMEAISDDRKFPIKIINRTDIFKGKLIKFKNCLKTFQFY